MPSNASSLDVALRGCRFSNEMRGSLLDLLGKGHTWLISSHGAGSRPIAKKYKLRPLAYQALLGTARVCQDLGDMLVCLALVKRHHLTGATSQFDCLDDCHSPARSFVALAPGGLPLCSLWPALCKKQHIIVMGHLADGAPWELGNWENIRYLPLCAEGRGIHYASLKVCIGDVLDAVCRLARSSSA